jgi:malonyl-CoA/methylmalonyl-CoA synthetase
VNLFEHFRSAFPADTNQVLLTDETGNTYSYADLEQESGRIANYLTSLGARPGDRITAQLEKSPAVLWLYLACLRAGLVYHPLNTAYQAAELEYFLTSAEPRIVVCGPHNASQMESLAESAGVEQVLTLAADGGGSLLRAAARLSPEFATVERTDEDLAALLYSSGTTGRPKGIMLSHGNLAANGKTLVCLWGFTTGDRLLHVLPIFHVHGLFVAVHCALLSGAAMYWMSKFEAVGVLRAMPACTVMMGVPTYYTRLLAEPGLEKGSCSNMRLFISGSAPLLRETFEAFRLRTGHTILERYGMSETGMNTSNPLRGERRAGTVGLPLPDVQVRVVDEGGDTMPADTTGNLQVRGPNVFSGYWRMPDKTREDFTEDGFFETGDKGLISADGYVSIVGRTKDLIISGGLNVYPKEVELLLDELEGVYESAVIGVPHADFGEAVVAVIVPEPGVESTAAELLALLKPRLANFKLPKRIVFQSELPRNAMGKLQKNLLREQYANACEG